MSNFLPPDNSNGLNLRDWQHAARLYVDDTYRLAPKPKFLHYTVFNINPDAINGTSFQSQSGLEINYLVKRMDLPRYTLNVENLNQYNRKTTTYTRISYDPVNLAFHDDNAGVSDGLWALYYGYYFADRLNSPPPYNEINPAAYQVHTYDEKALWPFRYGLDNNIKDPFFRSIQLLTLTRHKFTSYLLCNPKVLTWQHDTMDQSEGGGMVENQMSVAYDAVIYSTGTISYDNPTGFTVLHYDNMQSPLNPSNELMLQSTIPYGIMNSTINPIDQMNYNPIDYAISQLQQAQANPFQGNLLPYGYGEYVNLNPRNNPYTTSGLQNYNFSSDPTTNSGTITPTTVVTGSIVNTIVRPPVDQPIVPAKSVRENVINEQFSSTTKSVFTKPVVTDVYKSNLPKNSPAKTESEVFGSINTGRTLTEPAGAVNISYFAQADLINNNIVNTSEIIANNPQKSDIPNNPFE